MTKANIKTKSGRRALAPRREPYWERIRTGLFVGHRVLDSGGLGTWIARLRDDDGKQKYHALEDCNEFDAAVRHATDWAEMVEQGVEQVDTTVGDACRQYVEHLRLHKTTNAARDTERRFTTLVYEHPIARLTLAKLRTDRVRGWLNAQVSASAAVADDDDDDALRRAKVSANRNLDSLKAALNFARRERLVATDAGWGTVYRFDGVRKRRERFLTLAERRALIAACPADLANLCTALMLTAARPGELANAVVNDLDLDQGTLALDGKTGRRIVSLSSAAIEFFKAQAKGRIGKAPLLQREYGGAWNKDAWKKIFKAAVVSTGLPPDVVLYSLRHAAISEFVAGGMDAFLVSRLAGTSTQMIDKHYGHLRHDRTRAAMDAVKVV